MAGEISGNGKIILGIDPGLTGSCSTYCPGSIVPTLQNGVFDLPRLDDEIDYTKLRDLIWDVRPDQAYIEYVNMRVSSPGAFVGLAKMVGTFYVIRAVCACLGVPCKQVMPGMWKKHFGLRGGKDNKDDARLHAIENWPALEPFLRRKKDVNRADAFLIAVYGYHRYGEDDL